MKNNVLTLFIAILTPFISCSASHDPIDQDIILAMNNLLITISENPEWETFCEKQKNNKQCRVINNTVNCVEQIKKIYHINPSTGIGITPFHFIKTYLMFHQMDHLESQLYSNSHYTLLEKNYRELCSQIEESKKQS